MKKIILILFIVFQVHFINSQDLTFKGFIPAISQTGRINPKLNYNLFVSTTIDAFNEFQNGTNYPARDLQLYIQPSLIYIYNNKLNFAVSYTYQRNNPLEATYVNEHRLWQQSTFTNFIQKSRLTHRVRLEERFIENRTTGDYPLSTRARYQLGFNMPFQGKTLDPKEFYLNTYNEFYFSLTGTKNATYSENWTYLGTGYNFGKMGRLEFGYLLQTAVRNTNGDLRFLHLGQVLWITNFELFKRKHK